MSKLPLPTLRSDEEAEDFVANADLSLYDLSGGVRTHFEFAAKSANVSMRLPQSLLDAVKEAAKRDGVPYQRYIRRALEQALQKAG